jgi:hypothetical protein
MNDIARLATREIAVSRRQRIRDIVALVRTYEVVYRYTIPVYIFIGSTRVEWQTW